MRAAALDLPKCITFSLRGRGINDPPGTDGK